jgi:predicted GH43/DUF377 family glycosyl hydrolase
MNWSKQGLVFSPSGQHAWMQTHASLAVPLKLDGDFYRIYFASRDTQNRSHVGYVELNIKKPAEIRYISPLPVLAPGPLGHFDDHGVYAASIVEYQEKLFMYYIGWNPGARRPLFYSSIGLAVSEDYGKSFRKSFSVPILTRSEFDPCLVTSPYVLRDGDKWRMWYVSGFKWEEVDDELHSYYHIKYAESKDGVEWERNGLVCIDLRAGERNIARPCVIKEDGMYKMWYSYNLGDGYRAGFADSTDGYVWTRRDEEAGIDVSESGWDSEAIDYPWVFIHEGRKYMLYNGNGFGRDGFGIAWGT